MIRIVPTALVAILGLALAGCAGTEEPTIESGALDASPQTVAEEQVDEEPAVVESEAAPSPDPAPSPAATEPSPAASPVPTFDEVCAGREDEAFIEVLTPIEGATVSDPITVTGCGNTFEATYQYRLETADGTVLVEDFGTMSCGSGCVGEFTFDVTAGTTGDVVLVLFETSMEDGSRQSVVEVSLTVA